MTHFREALRQIGWTTLLALSALFLVGLAFRGQWTWGLFNMFTFQPRYADTVAILASGEAKAAGMDVYAPNPLDPLHRPHVYGPGWLITGSLGLTTRDAAWVGPVVVGLFLVVAACVMAPKRGRDFFVSLPFLCSPPILLGLDRANNDLVMFAILVVGIYLLSRRGVTAEALGDSFLALAATLKLYPFAALPAICLRRERRGRCLISLLATCVAGVAVILLWWPDFRQAIGHAPHPETMYAYGLPAWWTIWRALPGHRAELLVGWLLGVAVVVVLLGWRTKRLWTDVRTTGFDAMAFVVGSLCWIFSFCAISNYPYRVVMLILPARVWIAQWADSDGHGTGRVQLWLWIVVAWMRVAKEQWAPLARTDPTISTPAWAYLKLIVGWEQGLMAALTVALAISAAGVLVRRFSEPAEQAVR